MAKEKEITTERILRNLKVARTHKQKWVDEAKEDFRFLLGKQWKDEDKEELENKGVPALTINKIQPQYRLVTGFERQNRTDFFAFPEGDEDSLVGEVITRLLKNIMKRTEGEYKLSEQFEDGLTCGESYLEPYIDYTYDLLTGEMKLVKDSPFDIFVDPGSKEYDLSDAEYVIKLKTGLSKDQLYQLFPEKQKEIDKIKDGKLDLDNVVTKTVGSYYKKPDRSSVDDLLADEPRYDLVEYYYKKYIKKYLVADKVLGKIQECLDKEEAERYKEFAIGQTREQYELEGKAYTEDLVNTVVILERMIPEIWLCSVIGNNDIFQNERSWSYPAWRYYPIIPFFAYRITVDIEDEELMVQGLVRSLKDPQSEVNKRRSQELRHLNSSANSGWLNQTGAWANKTEVEKLGASSGVVLEYNKEFERPQQIFPQPLSAGHEQLVQLASQDLKEISGINADALAMMDKTASGKAIALRQRQAFVMLQTIFDNWSRTKRISGRFLLSQLGEIYTVETAIKVLGNSFIDKNFARPKMGADNIPVTGTDGELITEVDPGEVGKIINQILTDSNKGIYDVKIGESSYSETIKFMNSVLLMDLVEKGVPIPPEVIIDESQISDASKIRIKEAIRVAQESALRGGK